MFLLFNVDVVKEFLGFTQNCVNVVISSRITFMSHVYEGDLKRIKGMKYPDFLD